MDKICIRKSPNADSRSANGPIDIKDLTVSTDMHIHDVQNALRFIAERILFRGPFHDHTKMEKMNDFCNALNSGHIKDTEWYNMHINNERHHLKSKVPDDVNLIDVIEHICDCVMAGLARSGEVYDVDLSPEILTLALNNTVTLLKESTYIDKGEKAMEDPLNYNLDE